jgi:hypothetical protein
MTWYALSEAPGGMGQDSPSGRAAPGMGLLSEDARTPSSSSWRRQLALYVPPLLTSRTYVLKGNTQGSPAGPPIGGHHSRDCPANLGVARRDLRSRPHPGDVHRVLQRLNACNGPTPLLHPHDMTGQPHQLPLEPCKAGRGETVRHLILDLPCQYGAEHGDTVRAAH